MRQQITAGGIFDFLTKDELDLSMGHHFEHFLKAQYRGLDYMSFVGAGSGTATFTIPESPEPGYCWSLKLLSVQLSAAGSVAYYVGTNPSAGAAIATVTSSVPNNDCPVTFTSNVVVLKDGQQVTVVSTTPNINFFHMRVLQVPTEMQGKL